MEGPLELRFWSGMDRRIRLMERDGFMDHHWAAGTPDGPEKCCGAE
jgi:hypothetical protein